MKSPSILIIDDEPENFDVIETYLSISTPATASTEQRDYQLYYAASGKEAIATLDTFNPDLILLDVMMPDLDGIEVCRHIKAMQTWRSVPIIMVTALHSKSILAACLAAGADDFITKPIHALELQARVGSMLRIKQQYDDLQTLLKFREDMANMIVHDLRNPLSSIKLDLDLLSNPGYPSERYPQKLSQILAATQSLQELIDDLLRMALFESGKIRLDRKAVVPCDLVQSVISTFEAIAAQKNQTLIGQFSNSSQCIDVDVTLFRRTLDNLLSNAIKFSPRNSTILVNFEFPTLDTCRLQVIDSGPGVPDALRQKIFEKYEIGTPMSNIPQIGLGLAFCKMVIEAHGGTIEVKSNQPTGSIFEITLIQSV